MKMFHLTLSTWYGELIKQSNKATRKPQKAGNIYRHTLRLSFSENQMKVENMAESSGTWQVACGTQNWIQLARWFRLISAPHPRRERWYALWAKGEQRFYAVQHL